MVKGFQIREFEEKLNGAQTTHEEVISILHITTETERYIVDAFLR